MFQKRGILKKAFFNDGVRTVGCLLWKQWKNKDLGAMTLCVIVRCIILRLNCILVDPSSESLFFQGQILKKIEVNSI